MSESERNSLHDVLMTEEAITKQSYEEGLQQGLKSGQHSSYEFGYAEGLKLGKELSEYYTLCLLNLEKHKHSKLAVTLARIVNSIRELPLQNEENINDEVCKIRLLHKLVQSSCKQITYKLEESIQDDKLSF